MADIKTRLILDVEVTFTLNAEEAAALGALAGYGTDGFLEVFYKHMGKAYLRPYEKGLRSLFSKIRGTDNRVSKQLGAVRSAIAEFHNHERRQRPTGANHD